MEYKITTPLKEEDIVKLNAGDTVKITGVIYTARDAAHARLVKLLEEGKELPIDVRGQVIYYVGPTPAKPGKPIGSAGPTTSYRMDAYAPRLIKEGLKGMIGKGARSKEVKDAFSQKLADNNEVWDEKKKNSYERKYPFIFFKTALYDWKEIYNKVIRKRKK